MHPPIHRLQEAISSNTSYDAFAPRLSPPQWEALGRYLQPVDVAQGHTLIVRGTRDWMLFFVESGVLSVDAIHRRDGDVQVAILAAGSVVGEGSFFSRLPRLADVSAISPARLWRLSPMRFAELSERQPALAVELALALGAVLATRSRDRLRHSTIA
jgi:CRP/FNR family cyclic AMP-dependent transcriptional regulator